MDQSGTILPHINVKTADKYLQFGLDKCKAMIVGKQLEDSHCVGV
jgi:hypothetical protein